MLCELSIENLALFERASLAFGDGLNVVSGETGAGKSLLVGALELLLGARSKAARVRKGADEARVEGRFELSAEQFLQIRSLSLFVLPEAIAVAGVLVWWSRRRAPSR